MNFTIPATDLRRMVDRLKLTRGQQWFGLFLVYGDDDLIVRSSGEVVSAEVYTSEVWIDRPEGDLPYRVALPLHRLDAWLSGVDGEVRATQDGSVVTFETDDASLPVPTVPGYEPMLPPVPSEALPLPGEVWEALSRVSWAARPFSNSPPTWRNMLHVSKRRVWASEDHRSAMVNIPEHDTPISFYPDVADILRTIDTETMVATVDRERRLYLSDQYGRYVVPTFCDEVPDDALLDRLEAIADANTHRVSSNRKEMMESLSFLKSLMANNSERVIVSCDEGCLLEVVTADDHSATWELPCTGHAPRIGLNLSNLRSALGTLSTEEATLHLGGERAPVMMKEGGYTALVMPIVGGAPARARHRKALAKPRF
jgi:hypothetical protein